MYRFIAIATKDRTLWNPIPPYLSGFLWEVTLKDMPDKAGGKIYGKSYNNKTYVTKAIKILQDYNYLITYDGYGRYAYIKYNNIDIKLQTSMGSNYKKSHRFILKIQAGYSERTLHPTYLQYLINHIEEQKRKNETEDRQYDLL